MGNNEKGAISCAKKKSNATRYVCVVPGFVFDVNDL